MEFPEPVISIAIEPKTKADLDKLGVSLAEARLRGSRRSAPSPTRRRGRPSSPAWASSTWRSSSTASSASSRSTPTSASPRSPTARRSARRSTTSRAASSARPAATGSTATCVIDIEPAERGAGFVFENDIVGGIIPKEFIPSIEKGIREAHEPRRARRLPGGRRQGRACTTAATTRSTRRARPSRSPASMAFQEARQAGRRRTCSSR